MQLTRDLQKYTEDYATGDYIFENILIEYRRKKVLEILKQYKPQNILEIGCGQDSIVNYYSDFATFSIVEPSKEFISKAVKNKNDKIKLYNDYFENKIEEFKKINFDFVILSSLLHEIPNPQTFLENVISICNKETVLHINVPNAKSFHLLWAYESNLIQELNKLTDTANKLQQNSTFTLDKLCDIADFNNLDVLDKGSYFIKPFNHLKMAQILDNGLINKDLLNGLYKLSKYMPELGAEIFINCRIK